jgi:hypothetical protein
MLPPSPVTLPKTVEMRTPTITPSITPPTIATTPIVVPKLVPAPVLLNITNVAADELCRLTEEVTQMCNQFSNDAAKKGSTLDSNIF